MVPDTMRGGNARVLLASLMGTAVEFYDFYIYATAASIVFGPLFFPAGSAEVELLSSYASFGLAFVARPLGGAVFGHFGDRLGRKSTLVASLLLMGGSTTAIAFLPTYDTVGWWAPLMLCLLRFGQGLGLGGEWSGAALLAVENAPPGWRARFGMVPQLGAPIGFIAANGFFLLLGAVLTPEQFRDWGWRIPFLASAVLVGLGLWVRVSLAETPTFARVIEAGPPARVPLAEVVRDYGGRTIAATLAVVACFALYYIATAFSLGHGTTRLGYDRQDFLIAQLGAILFMAVGIVLAGWAADRSNPRRVLIWGCLGTILSGVLIAPLLGSGSMPVVFVFLSIALLAMGFVYGPLGAWLPGLFPPKVRYSGASLAFNVGGILGGAVSPAAGAVLAARGGLPAVGIYLAGAGVVSLAALLAMGRLGRGSEPVGEG